MHEYRAVFFLPYGQLCIVLQFVKNIVHLAQRLHLGSLASQANQSTLFKCDRHSSALSSTVISAILYAFIVESLVLICSKRDDRFFNLVMEQRES